MKATNGNTAKKRAELEQAVVRLAVDLHDCEETLERGFPRATCSGPERHYMAERLKLREQLSKACAELKRRFPKHWDHDYIIKSIEAER